MVLSVFLINIIITVFDIGHKGEPIPTLHTSVDYTSQQLNMLYNGP